MKAKSTHISAAAFTSDSSPLASMVLTLDRSRELRLSMRALKRFTQSTGKDIIRDAGRALANQGDFAVLVWSMAVETDASATLEMIRPYVTIESASMVCEMLKNARLAGERSPHSRN